MSALRAIACGTALGLLACGRSGHLPTLRGAGASLPFPLLSRWVEAYPGARVDYQSVGSGGALRQLEIGALDFGATDVAMTDAELARATAPTIHVPLALGAVAVAANLSRERLALRRRTLGRIWLGEITRWDDPEIAADNPGAGLPGLPIVLVHRSDGSGTTKIFTTYLSIVSPSWAERVGSGASARWPAGIGAKGTEGVAGVLGQTQGALGYLEVGVARKAGLTTVALENRAGQLVEPSVRGLIAATEHSELPGDLRGSLVDCAGAETYPLATYVFALVPLRAGEGHKSRAVAGFLRWSIHDGRGLAGEVGFAPLPEAQITRVDAALARVDREASP